MTTQTQGPPVARPMPVPDELSRFFWDGVKAHRLLIQRCVDCGKYIHWPRPICRFCLSSNLEPQQVSGKGTLWSYTVMMYPYHPGFEIPYTLASIELVEQQGLKLVSNVIDCPEPKLRVGMPLEVVFSEVSPGLTLPLFRPAT